MILLRRIADSSRNQDWTTVFIELIVFAPGAFLGLQAENRADPLPRLEGCRLMQNCAGELRVRFEGNVEGSSSRGE